MTAFKLSSFTHGSMYLHYIHNGERRFVARFKYVRGGQSDWIKFMIANFTVEEYFAAMDAGVAPLKIMEAKGYVLPHIRKWLKARGLPQTQAGLTMMIEQDRAAREARATA
jgi:hypothetical protein